MEYCKFSKKQIYITLFLCIIPIVLCVIMNLSLVYAFLSSFTFAILMSLKNGFTTDEIKTMILKDVIECRSLYIVVLLIGATVSVWLSSGVVPSMIFYGLSYMEGMNILFSAFILISISSIFIGTAVGTISTIGIAIIGIGKGFGIPAHILVGAIVSGAYLADKISPLSGILNLTITTTETNYKEVLKSSTHTIIPTIIICAIIYFLIGNQYSSSETSEKALQLIKAMDSEFLISPCLILMPVSIVILSTIGVKSNYCMISVVIIVIGAISLSSILQGTGIINYLTKDIIYKISTRKELILKTGLISGVLTAITCDQTMGIVVPSRLLKSKYKDIGVDNSVLARTISDTGTIIAPLMPWNINALIISLVTGVSCIAYAPFAMLCFIAPLVTCIMCSIKNTFKSRSNESLRSGNK